MSSTIRSQKPHGLLRWFLRSPIFLYRIGLGRILGERFLLLKHTGRKSGEQRQAVIEVIGHQQSNDTYYVVSGWGKSSNWYRNLQHQPRASIQVGRRHLSVYAENCPIDEGVEVLQNYIQRSPTAAKGLSRVLGIDLTDSSPDSLRKIILDQLPIMAFRPELNST